MTIYALSSGPGLSGVAIIRVSGRETKKIIKLLTNKPLPTPRLASLRKINKINTSELIDEGILLWFPAPHSYTGEDMAEFQVHGGKAVIDALHNSLSQIDNCRLAGPGEFTRLAFQNGKINLLKAESIADLISSETEIQRQQAIKIMSGKSSQKFNEWRAMLLKILSNVEAKIDFPEENLPDGLYALVHLRHLRLQLLVPHVLLVSAQSLLLAPLNQRLSQESPVMSRSSSGSESLYSP